MTDYTPNTGNVLIGYTKFRAAQGVGTGHSVEEFRRWYADLIRKAKTQAWDEGYRSGHSRAMRRMSDEPSVPPAINPYTEE